MTGSEGLASRFQPDTLAGAYYQYTHNEAVITELRVSADYTLGGHAETPSQITDPSRWMATQALIFLPTLTGSTRQYMMKGVPSFL